MRRGAVLIAVLGVAFALRGVCAAEVHELWFPSGALESVSHPATDAMVLPMDHGGSPVGRDEVGSRLAASVMASGRDEAAKPRPSNDRRQLVAGVGEISDQIDAAVWEVISATVAANDSEGMAAVYHPDAVLVSPRGTVAIAEQLVKWGEGMERIAREGRGATVAFRFSSRQDNAGTAFERGMFRYAETDEHGVEQPVFIPFEALLVKKDGRWLMVMERQLEAADETAWNALPQ